jgi:hypothetical protein
MGKKKWETRYEDTPGGKYMRRVSLTRFHIIEWLDWVDAVGEREAAEVGAKYNVELTEVDLEAIPPKALDGALSCCDFESWGQDIGDPSDRAAAIAECCHDYGAKAPLWDSNGNNLRELIRAAKRESNELVTDDAAYHERMTRPVNALGSTALEYMQGDIHSAMRRGVENGNQDACLMAKIYGAPDDVIERVKEAGPQPVITRVKLRRIPSDDPLAYMVGYQDAVASSPMAGPREDLAEAYVEGYRLGTLVRCGEAERPEWAA